MNINTEVLKSYLTECENVRNLSKHTIKAYKGDLKQLLEFIKGNDIKNNRDLIYTYVSSLNCIYKTKTVKRKLASIRVFFEYLKENADYNLDLDFLFKLKIKEDKTLPRIIEKDNINRLYKVLYEEKQYVRNLDLRDKAIIELLFSTGIRVSELCSLKLKDINLIDSVLSIFGKGRKERKIYLGNAQVKIALEEYKFVFRKNVDNNDYFFINRYGNQLGDQTIRNIIKDYCIEAGISANITPHMFRHTFATMLLEEDVDIRYIQQILGHTSILTTQIYTHISQNKQRNILVNKNPRNKINM